MDHEFTFDPIACRYEARLDDGLEAVGYWLSSEIGIRERQLQRCLALIHQGLQEPQLSLSFPGRRYSLSLHQGEVCIRANGSDLPLGEDWEEEGFSLYQSESVAWCGAEDLRALLLAWHEFIR